MTQRRSPCVIVPKMEGERVKRRLDKLGFRELSLKIRLRGTQLMIPLTREAELDRVVRGVPEVELKIASGIFEVGRVQEKNLASFLTDLDSTKVKLIPQSFDVIGDIAIIELPPGLSENATRIGTALLTLQKRLKSVYVKAGHVVGDYRLRQFKHAAGEQRTVTIHRENGCQFQVDVATVFFNPRLGGERLRVAKQVQETESVLDMFAGVGPFSILIAQRTNAKVIAVDSNPEAIRYLRENILINHVEGQVEVLEGDAARIAERLRGKADRIIMNLPERSMDFVAAACKALRRRGGMLHFYSFQEEPEVVRKAETLLTSRVRQAGRDIAEIRISKPVREIAPRTYQVVVDAVVS